MPIALYYPNWPDSGLTRNTQGLCYRCSVPGLAGFTKTAVVRSPKSDNLSNVFDCQLLISSYRTPRGLKSKTTRDDLFIGNRQLEIGNELDRGLSVRQHPEKSVDCEVK